MREILIYNDEGVGTRARVEVQRALARIVPEDLYQVRSADALELGDPAWVPRASLLVVPGGADIPYDQKLRGGANRNIRSFVEGGGSYLGLCAGAYYGCAKVEFDKGGPLEVCQDRELCFFPGSAVGPAFGTYSYSNEQGACAAGIEWCSVNRPITPNVLRVYFNGGCFFRDPSLYPQVQTIARYTELPEKPAAMVICQVGKGRALLCGAHPEYSHAVFEVADPHLSKILGALKESEESRDTLLKAMLLTLGVRCEIPEGAGDSIHWTSFVSEDPLGCDPSA
jgi:glutamine amidotransferase-like uncharacterized protein